MKKKNSTNARFTLLLSFGGILLGSLLALYIFQVNNVTQQVYAIETQEQKVSELREKANALEFKRLRASTRENMESMAQDLNFERVARVTYLKTAPAMVAQNPLGQ